MTRSKESLYTNKHERHVARNGFTDVRNPVKKSGAGFANWGSYADEIANVDDKTKEHPELKDNSRKLQLVDQETFQSLRQPEQNV